MFVNYALAESAEVVQNLQLTVLGCLQYYLEYNYIKMYSMKRNTTHSSYSLFYSLIEIEKWSF